MKVPGFAVQPVLFLAGDPLAAFPQVGRDIEY
jgi:hypothetical protein